MPIAPFDEAPYDRYQQQPVSGGINTNSYDQFRQGVSIRTQRELYMGMCPKMLPERQFTPDSGNDSTVYGQPKAFKDVVPFQDLEKFHPVKFISSSVAPAQMYPRILANASLVDPYQLDGVLEPLVIRAAVSMTTLEGSDPAHAIKGELLDGNMDERRKASQIVQIYDYRPPVETKPFIDFPEYFGSGSLRGTPEPDSPAAWSGITMPGVISATETRLQPFVDTTHQYRMIYDAYNYASGTMSPDMFGALQVMSGSSQTMLRSNQVSSTAGFVYDNNPLGTDSLAFGGWKK